MVFLAKNGEIRVFFRENCGGIGFRMGLEWVLNRIARLYYYKEKHTEGWK